MKKTTKRRRINKPFFIGSLMGFALGAVCMFNTLSSGDWEEIKITHKVRPNETLWGICQTYYNENHLSNDVYFLQFMHDVEQENEWLKETNYKLQPNDIIKISYKKQKPRTLD